MNENHDSQLRDLIAGLVTKRNEFRQGILDKCDSAFSEQRSILEDLNGECEAYLNRFDELKERAEGIIEEIGQFDQLIERVDALAEEIDKAADRYDEVCEGLNGQIESLGEAVDETIESTIRATEMAITDQNEAIEDLVAGAAGSISDKSNRLVEIMEGLRPRISRQTTSFLEEQLLGGVKSDAEHFLGPVRVLTDTGLAKIKELTNLFGSIEKATRPLTELIEAVKPVLAVVRQVL